MVVECENELLSFCAGVDSVGLHAEWRYEELFGPYGCWVSHRQHNQYVDILHVFCLKKCREKEQTRLPREFLRFSREIAAGMVYLSKKSFVHRDLAARNILLDDRMSCKASQLQ